MLKQFRSIFLLCLIIPLLMGCESRKTIVSGLSEKDANEILVFLSGKGINAIKVQTAEVTGGARKEVTFDILVRSDQAAEAMALLNQAGLPRPKGQSLLSIFKESSGLVPSEMQEKIKKQAGTAEQIANTIRRIDGILDVEVLISVPEENPLSIEKSTSQVTASVFIKHNGVLDDPNSHLVSKIKRLVAASVPGLNYDNVTVIGIRARYSDYPIIKPGFFNEEKQYTSVWSIIVAKESLTAFQVLSFSFILIILILLLILLWILWKTLPLLKNHGGIGTLFRLTPAEEIPEKSEEETEKKEEKDKVEEEKENEEEGGPPNEVS